jgi:hypothetical protein
VVGKEVVVEGLVGERVVAGRVEVGEMVVVVCEVVEVAGVVVCSLPPPQAGSIVAATRRDKITMVNRHGIETQEVFFIQEALLQYWLANTIRTFAR